MGRGRYMDDLEAENALHLRSVRSQMPHGVLNEVHTDDARAAPETEAVVDG